MLKPQKWHLPLIAAAFLLAGCGGGGGGAATSVDGGGLVASKVVSWTPPATYTDNSALDPARDLSHYEIFINQNRSTPDAIVSAVANGNLVTSFDLSGLGPFFNKGVNTVTMRSVTMAGETSDFSAPGSFSL